MSPTNHAVRGVRHVRYVVGAGGKPAAHEEPCVLAHETQKVKCMFISPGDDATTRITREYKIENLFSAIHV